MSLYRDDSPKRKVVRFFCRGGGGGGVGCVGCCGCSSSHATDAVDPTAHVPQQQRQRPSSLALSSSLSQQSSLAYLDAVQSENDWSQMQGEEEEHFYDANDNDETLSEHDASVYSRSRSRNKKNSSRPLVVVTREVTFPELKVQDKDDKDDNDNLSNQQDNQEKDKDNDSNHDDDDDDDEALLAPEYRTDGSTSTSRRHGRRRRRLLLQTSPEQEGFPGHLTPDQLQAYRQLRNRIRKHGTEHVYYQMVYNYVPSVESESYALCRYLRLTNFHVPKVLQHMDQAAQPWKQAAQHNFYPRVVDAVGAPLSVLLTQFPSVYYGLSKQGYPCCYFNAGALSVEGIECVTECDRLANVIWHNMMHDMKYNKFPQAKKRHQDFQRLEQITILNLKGLSRSLFTPKVYNALQQVDATAAIFPEMLHSLIVIYAPGFFSFFWSVIRRLLDAKTASLIEIYSSPEKGRQRLLELIDESELPSDYGGMAPCTGDIILREGRTTPTTTTTTSGQQQPQQQPHAGIPHRQIVKLLHVVGKQHERFAFALQANERVELCIYTRSTAKCHVSLSEADDDEEEEEEGDRRVLHTQEINANAKVPTRHDFGNHASSTTLFVGPRKFAVNVQLADRHSSGKHFFLVIGEVFSTGKQ